VSESAPDGRAYVRLILLGAAIGIPAAFAAAAFLAFVHTLERWLWDDLPHHLGHSAPPWYLVVGLPAAGGLVVAAARRLPGDGGHSPLAGLGGGAVPPLHGPGIVLAAVGTLAFGAVLGPEAPLIALGSVVALTCTRFARLGAKESGVLGMAGSFSAISALFGGPLVAAMLLVEGGLALGEALIPVLLPGFVAAAIGYVIFVGLGSWGGLDTQTLVVPGLPPYTGTHILDLLLAVAIGALAAVGVGLVRRLAVNVERAGVRGPSVWMLLLAGGLAVGLLAELADLLGADSQDVLFSGQTSIPGLVEVSSAKVIAILLVAKGLAYAVSLGAGFRGGPIFPAIFLGVALAALAEHAFDTSPTLAVAIGAAAGMAATTRLLVAPVLLAALLVGRTGVAVVPAAVLAACTAYLVVRAVEGRAAAAEQAPAAGAVLPSP
jgi:H+/Cl- antiporter ClcA